MSALETISHHCKTLRLPTIAEAVPEALTLAQQQDWSLESFLAYLLEQEASGRQQRRIERLLREAHLPPDKTLARFDQARLPLRLRRQLSALIEGEFINQADNILIFGQPGTGKTHPTKYPYRNNAFPHRTRHGH
jgi:DNA replication protein DnaC